MVCRWGPLWSADPGRLADGGSASSGGGFLALTIRQGLFYCCFVGFICVLIGM